eukprot:CAMPEP_0174269642 /NCGR_PEP_ID=MMETSP0439-20130205/41735_1 /TAXON_ID=0 /ORGANISM="Stereomyxa ramosa, Strain Chinc5" /LENGTH=52 /DNA_ID=CAMNT_0015358521 /DNA_START=15 /DNA_END=169 /DNA_ORIENTATION=-
MKDKFENKPKLFEAVGIQYLRFWSKTEGLKYVDFENRILICNSLGSLISSAT